MRNNGNLSPEQFEQRAEEQRERITESVSELRESVRETVRERLDINAYARNHLAGVAGIASLFAFVTGYAIAGMFTRH